MTPNSVPNNMIFQYQLIQVFSLQGAALTDLSFRMLPSVAIQDTYVSSIAVSQGYVVVGCSQCNTYRGRIDIFNRNALNSAKLGSVEGASDN